MKEGRERKKKEGMQGRKGGSAGNKEVGREGGKKEGKKEEKEGSGMEEKREEESKQATPTNQE